MGAGEPTWLPHPHAECPGHSGTSSASRVSGPECCAVSDKAITPGFAPRGAGLAESRKAFAAAQRRRLAAVTMFGGWMIGGIAGPACVGLLGVMMTRPAARDVPFVLIEHDDHSFEPAVPREDLSPSRTNILLDNTFRNYVRERESYSWQGVMVNFRRVYAMSAPEERDRYQKLMFDTKSPENPQRIYGDTVNAAIADVVETKVFADRVASPNFVEVWFRLKIIAPNVPPRFVSKRAKITWADDPTLPVEVQKDSDPAGIVITHYSSFVEAESRP